MNADSKISDFVQELLSLLTEQCQCMLESDQFTDSHFVCFEQSPKKVTFFSDITGTLQLPISELIDYLESLVASGTKVTVQQQSLDIDSDCMARVPNTEEECVLEFAMQESVNTPVNVPVISFLGILIIVLILGLLLLATAYYIKTRIQQRIKSPRVRQEPSPL